MKTAFEFRPLISAVRGLRKAAFPVTALALATSAPFAHAASDAWTGTADATWANTSNWNPSVAVPGTGDTATFNAASGNTTIDLGAGVTLGTLLFDTSSAAAYTIGSGAVGSQTLTFSSAITMNATVANDQLINANLAYGGNNPTVTNNSTTNALTLAGSVTGTGNFTKSGAGTVVLNGGGSVSQLNVANGRLSVTGGTLSSSSFSFLGNTASQTGIVNVTSGGTLKLNHTNGGGLGWANNSSGVIYNAGTFTGTQFYLTNDVSTTNAYAYIRNTGTMTIGNTLGIGRLGNAALLDIVGGTTSITTPAGNPLIISSGANGVGGLNISGGGTFAIGGSSGQSVINTGLGAYTSINIVGSGSKLSTGAGSGFNLMNNTNTASVTTLTLANGGELDTQYLFSNKATHGPTVVNFNNGTLKATATDGSGLINNGSGSVGTNISVYIHSGGAAIDTNGVNTSIKVPILAPTGNGVTNISLGGTATGYVGAPIVKISGDGEGAAAVANFDPTTGTVTGITITSPGSGYTTTPTVTLVGGNGGATGAGAGTATGTATIGAVTGGGLTKTGAGTLTLAAANTYTGATTINNGTLTLASTGSLASTSFNIAAGGIFDVSAQASYSLSGKTITLSLSDTTAGSINAGALDLALGGTLTLNLTTGAPGTDYFLYSASSATGSFDAISLSGNFSGSLSQSGDLWTGSSNGYSFSLDQTTGALSVAAVPEPSVIALLSFGLAGVLFLRRRHYSQL